jgi:acyl-ACP thioesterase
MSKGLKPEWRTEHVIRSYDVDPHQTARLPALCRFMQEAAYHHAEHLGLGHAFLSDQGMAWVLARQRIQIDRLPKWGDRVHLRTWPSGRDRLFFYRDFEITDGDGNRSLIASNAWSLIDIEKRERVHSDIYLSLDIPEGEKVFDTKLGRVKGCDGAEQLSIPVTYGDLDLNGHVNNVRYIEWLLNSLPTAFHSSHILTDLEINFLGEARHEQTVGVCSAEYNACCYSHTLKVDDTELVRARTAWTKKES